MHFSLEVVRVYVHPEVLIWFHFKSICINNCKFVPNLIYHLVQNLVYFDTLRQTQNLKWTGHGTYPEHTLIFKETYWMSQRTIFTY